MRNITFSLWILLCSFVPVKAQMNRQKLPINQHAYENWTNLQDAKISNDGKYVCYTINNQPKGSKTLTVTSADHKRHKEFTGASSAVFSEDSRYVYFLNGAGKLCMLRLADYQISILGSFSGFELSEYAGNFWIAGRLDSAQDLTILKPGGGLVRNFKHSLLLHLDARNRMAFIVNRLDRMVKLIKVSLSGGPEKIIWQGNAVVKHALSNDGNKLVFIGQSVEMQDDNDLPERYLIQYDPHTNHLDTLMRPTDIPENGKFYLSESQLEFTANEQNLLLGLLPANVTSTDLLESASSVEVWSYADQYLPPQFQSNPSLGRFGKEYHAVFNIQRKNLVRLTEPGEATHSISGGKKRLLIVGKEGPQAFYVKAQMPSLSIVSTESNSGFGLKKTIIAPGQSNFETPILSPDEQHVVWFDRDKATWFAYNVATAKTVNLSAAASQLLFDPIARKRNRMSPFGFAAWDMTDQSLLVYDQFDIWKLPLDGGEGINFTNGQGRKHRFALQFTDATLDYDLGKVKTTRLMAFDHATKSNAYVLMTKKGMPDLSQIKLDNYTEAPRETPGAYIWSEAAEVIKARDADVYLVAREKSTISRNLYLTKDFKTYTKLSNIHPEKEYRWLTSELVNYKTRDGSDGTGILYKPESFDPSNKYPVIFNYYEKRSNQLNKFNIPGYTNANIDIPSFVDQGYLIFVPDVLSFPGRNGEGTFNSIESAADYFSKLSFIDSTKMALQGHSYGGWETNYMVTHSNRFAAACEVAGASDLISGYGYTNIQGKPRNSHYETNLQGSAFGVGVTPWTAPWQYIRNSPVFDISNVNTPLLMVHNPGDDQVPFDQAKEFFLGLRRAEKKVWLLVYPNSGHAVYGPEAKDFHTKMLAFFDHYLKGTPAPAWMTKHN